MGGRKRARHFSFADYLATKFAFLRYILVTILTME